MKQFVFSIWNALRFAFGLRGKQDELDEEVHFHIEGRTDELMEQGHDRKEARNMALKEFGGMNRYMEECRDAWGMRVLKNISRDVGYSIRQLRKTKGYSVFLILTFVFCVGPCTLVFSIFNSLYLNPDRYPEADRVIRIYDEFSGYSQLGESSRATNLVLYSERKEQSEYLESISLQLGDHRNVQTGSDSIPEFLDLLLVTPSIFDVLKVYPEHGRRFHDSDCGPGSNERVVILTHQWWQTHLNGAVDSVGRSITIDGEPWEIVGVMPEGFSMPPKAGQWDVASIGLMIPYAPAERNMQPHHRHRTSPMGCLAAMKPGITKSMVESELATINASNATGYPDYDEFLQEHPLVTRAMTVGEDHIRDLESTFLLAILMSGFVWLAGSLSMANFVLARNSYRVHELATRASLGATKGRLVCQLLSETFIIAVLGAISSLLLAQLGLWGLSSLGMFAFFPMVPSLTLDAETVGAAIALSIVMVVICGIVSISPLLTTNNLTRNLSENSRTSSGSILLKRYRGGLVFVQSSIAVALLVNAGLLGRSFLEVLEIDPGYQTENLLFATIKPPDGRYSREDRFVKMLELEDRIQALPEVAAAGLTNWPPMKHPNIYRNRLVKFDDPNLEDAQMVSRDTVSPGYFDALGIKPVKGRLFVEADIVNREPVVVIDAALAERLFPEQDPIGKRFSLHSAGRPLLPGAQHNWQTVVGVVSSVRINDLYKPSPGMVYQHVGGQNLYWFGFVVKARSTTSNALKSMQELLLNLEPDVAVGQPVALESAIANRYGERKNMLYFCLGLAVISLCLALFGISGMISYSIANQKKEIGIRLALGAGRKQIIYGSVRFWLRLALAGMAVGLTTSILLSERAKSLLYNIEALDFPTYMFSSFLFAAAVLLAVYFSARKAAAIEPIEAMSM